MLIFWSIIKERFWSRGLLPFFHNICVTIRTYNNTIFLIESSPIFDRSFWNWKPLIFLVVGIKFLAAPVAYNYRAITLRVGALIKISVLDRLIIEVSGHRLPPFTGWLPSKCNPNDSCYFVENIYTGLLINLRNYPASPLSFRVIDMNHRVTLAEVEKFQQASRLAECYYLECMAVNSNGTVPNHRVTIPTVNYFIKKISYTINVLGYILSGS